MCNAIKTFSTRGMIVAGIFWLLYTAVITAVIFRVVPPTASKTAQEQAAIVMLLNFCPVGFLLAAYVWSVVDGTRPRWRRSLRCCS